MKTFCIEPEYAIFWYSLKYKEWARLERNVSYGSRTLAEVALRARQELDPRYQYKIGKITIEEVT